MQHRSIALTLILACVATVSDAQVEQYDQFQFYFGSNITDAGLLTGAAADEAGNFWVIGTGGSQRIRYIDWDGEDWNGTDMVIGEELNLFHRAVDLASGAANSSGGWGTQFGGSATGLSLNPAPLTIEVPTGSGGTEMVTYAPGTLAFVSDAVAVVTEPDGDQRADATKKIYRYDLRDTFQPTTASPDYSTARFVFNGPAQGRFGIADWNDVFQPVFSELDLRTEAGRQSDDAFLSQFAWSSDGQSLYAIDSSRNLGGIYRIDATRWANDPGGVQRIVVDNGASASEGDDTFAISVQPAVVSTAAFNYLPIASPVGDQIIVEGSFDSGNQGGVNVFLDTGGDTASDPFTLFTQEEFRDFADYRGDNTPRYEAFVADDAGNLYISEQWTRMLFRYDTEGRFSKLFGERELEEFQDEVGGGQSNEVVRNLSLRSSTAPGFDVVEVFYTDKEVSGPVGVLAFQAGDFDRDNDLDADDIQAFASRVQVRNGIVPDEDSRFDMNGNAQAFRDVDLEGNPVIREVIGGELVVDWKDVKILQEFALFPNGDTNFDFALDFTDLDTMAANYYTESGQTAETWIDGDFASIDPAYIFDAPDANLVNEVDLQVIADAWINDLGQAAPTDAELSGRYGGQFLADAIAAFSGGGLEGDYDVDGDVDGADYDAWVAAFGATGSGLNEDGNGDGAVNLLDYTIWRDNTVIDPVAADFNGDGVVNVLDYTVWRDSRGQTGAGLPADGNGDGVVDSNDYQMWVDAFGLSAASPVGVPEPATGIGCLLFFAAAARRTGRGTAQGGVRQ